MLFGILSFPIKVLVFLLYLTSVHANIPAAFIFGDSIFDTGNAVLQPNSPYLVSLLPPYGMTYFKKPTGRFSDGRTPTDFILEKLGLNAPPILYPGANFSTGANFATSGATTLSFLKGNQPLYFREQLNLFSNLISNPATSPSKEAIEKGLYVIEFGTNDIFSYFNHPEIQANYSIGQVLNLVSNTVESSIKELYGKGARKFLLIQANPVDCTPLMKLIFEWTEPGCVLPVTSLVSTLDNVYVSIARRLRKSLPGVTLLLLKQEAIRKIIQNPTKFGFIEGVAACCGGGNLLKSAINCALPNSTVCTDPSKYVFWDRLHGTDRLYKTLVDRAWAGSISNISPFNLRALSRKP